MPSSSTGTGIARKPVDLKDLQRARIGRRLDDDLVAGFGEALRDDRDPLRRAGQHDDARRARSRSRRAPSSARRSRRAAARTLRNRRRRARSADRARLARRTSRARRAVTARRAATPCTNEIRPGSGLAASSPRTFGNSPTRHGGKRNPPWHAGGALGLPAAKLRHDARARTDPLLDQALADQLAIGVHDRAAIDGEPLAPSSARAAAGSTRAGSRPGSPRADARRSDGRAGRWSRGRAPARDPAHPILDTG